MWVGDEGRVGIRFAVIEPVLFEELQHWTNRKMKEEGWDFPVLKLLASGHLPRFVCKNFHP